MEKFKQWSQLIMCGEIKPNEKIVLMVILNCNNMAWPYIAHTEIMKQSGLSESTTKRALAKLKKMGLITEVKSNTNNMNNYIVSGFNLNGLITSGVNLTPQVGSKTTTSGFNLTCNNNINKKDIDNNMDYNSSTGRDTTEHSNNNIGFKKGMYMELNSHSAKPTRVVDIGGTRYSVKDEEDNSSILASIPSSSPSKEKKYIHQITTTEDRKGNTQSNASLHNENEDSSMDCGGMSIDDLEDMFNGGNPTPTQTISKGGSKTTSIAKSNEGGGGQKFTPRKEWDIAMRLAIQHIGNSSDIRNRLTGDDLKIITEGTNDKYRVIDTLKAIQQMLTYRVNFSGYDVWLNNAIDTLEANEEAYTPKQFDYACEIYDDCVDRYEKITNNR